MWENIRSRIYNEFEQKRFNRLANRWLALVGASLVVGFWLGHLLDYIIR